MSKPTKITLPPLTARQQEVLAFIADEIAKKKRPPTVREIGAYLGVTSTNGVMQHLDALEHKGYIAREANSSRAITLLNQERGIPLLSLGDLSERKP